MTRATRRILVTLVSLLVIGGAIAGLVLWRKNHQPPLATYKTETVEKRKVVGRITATGTLQATVTVLVGTQISGRIAKLYADWNSKVTKGELVAKIDPQLYEAALLQAKANYEQSKAAEIKAIATEKNNEVQRDRTVALNKQSLAAVADVEAAQTLVLTSQADVNVAKSNVIQAQAQLAQAQREPRVHQHHLAHRRRGHLARGRRRADGRRLDDDADDLHDRRGPAQDAGEHQRVGG